MWRKDPFFFRESRAKLIIFRRNARRRFSIRECTQFCGIATSLWRFFRREIHAMAGNSFLRPSRAKLIIFGGDNAFFLRKIHAKLMTHLRQNRQYRVRWENFDDSGPILGSSGLVIPHFGHKTSRKRVSAEKSELRRSYPFDFSTR